MRPILFVFAFAFFASCISTTTYPPIPVIEYKDFVKYGSDSAHFIFSFKDGDGDIGFEQGDTLPPFNPSSIYYFDLYMKYYYKLPDGSFSVYVFPGTTDTLAFTFRIPNITPKGQNKVLDGSITTKLPKPYWKTPHKVIKFEAFIFDKALHKSNVITTPEIIVVN